MQRQSNPRLRAPTLWKLSSETRKDDQVLKFFFVFSKLQEAGGSGFEGTGDRDAAQLVERLPSLLEAPVPSPAFHKPGTVVCVPAIPALKRGDVGNGSGGGAVALSHRITSSGAKGLETRLPGLVPHYLNRNSWCMKRYLSSKQGEVTLFVCCPHQ